MIRECRDSQMEWLTSGEVLLLLERAGELLKKSGELLGGTSPLLLDLAGILGCCQRTSARKTSAISTRKCSCQKLASHAQLLVNF